MEFKSRKPNRLSTYDYGQAGCYFVTLCTHHRQPLFVMENADVGNGLRAVPNQILHKWLAELPNQFKDICVEQYVIMPDHLHFILTIKHQTPDSSLPKVMRFFKATTTNEYIKGVKTGLFPPFDGRLWQKSYYDHVIRNQQDYNETWEYIQNNPIKWMLSHDEL